MSSAILVFIEEKQRTSKQNNHATVKQSKFEVQQTQYNTVLFNTTQYNYTHQLSLQL